MNRTLAGLFDYKRSFFLLLLLLLLAAWPSFNLTPAIGNAKVALSTPSRHKYPKGRLFYFPPKSLFEIGRDRH